MMKRGTMRRVPLRTLTPEGIACERGWHLQLQDQKTVWLVLMRNQTYAFGDVWDDLDALLQLEPPPCGPACGDPKQAHHRLGRATWLTCWVDWCGGEMDGQRVIRLAYNGSGVQVIWVKPADLQASLRALQEQLAPHPPTSSAGAVVQGLG